jgi:hypothetical protein
VKADPKKLNEKQRSFLLLLAQGTPEREAAETIWNEDNAAKQLYKRSENLLAAMGDVKRGLAVALGISREDVLEGFQRAANMASIKEDPMAMIAAYRELGKMCGFYEPEVKRVEHALLTAGQFDELPDDKLLEIIGDDDPITLDKSQYEVVDVEVKEDEDGDE